MSLRKNKAYTATFPAIDPLLRPARKSGVSFSAGDSKVSLDGGTFANTTNLPAAIGTTGRYSITLTAAEMNADNVHLIVSHTSIDPVDLIFTTGGQPAGSVVADGSNTSLTFKTDLVEAVNDYWKDALILFTSGSLAGQVKRVSSYDGTTKFLAVSAAFTAAPSGGDRFVLVNL